MTNLKVKQDIDIDTSANSSVPVGALLFIGGLDYTTVNNQTWVDENGLVVCNGQAISRTTYSNLFSVIGTTWGSGDGSTTFNVPNFYSTRRFMTMPPFGINISSTASAQNHNHSNSSISNATGNLASSSYDHSSHAGNFVTAGGGGHGDYFGGVYVNTNGSSVNDNAKAGNTSPVAINSHTHAMTQAAHNLNSGGDHSHTFGFNVGASSGTSHEHTFTTNVESVSDIIVGPGFTAALCFIKI